MTKLPSLASYSREELSQHRLPKGNPYQDLLGGNPLYDIRHESWLKCALATVMNRASAREVCWHWSQTADQLIQKVFQDTCDARDMAVYALGKLGAQELNLSSDIDLLVISKSGSPDSVRQVREFHRIMSQPTAQGFLFRCDFDLRPGGKSSPLVPTLDQVIDYYGNYGETWERIAFVRSRFITGSTEVKTQLEPFMKRFIYRRHLDYTLLEDLKGLREKIQRAVKIDGQAIHLKLVPGGIRDIELFINSLQVIHGGKNPKLQITNTNEAFDKIQSEQILPATDAEFFKNLYWRLRALENYVQAQEDGQTHSIQKSGDYPSFVNKALKNLESDLIKSSTIVGGLLGNIDSVHVDIPLDQELQAILEIPLLSRNKERDQKTRALFIQRFSEALANSAGDRTLALSFLKEFVTSVRAKSGLFTILAREGKLVEDLAWLFGHSPYLSQILCRRPELLDSFIYRSQELQHNEVDILLEQLLEKRLLSEIIEGTEFLKNRNVDSLLRNLTSVANEITSEILNVLGAQELRVLCLGKWGGRELGFKSDLDFILVTENEPGENHIRWARRLISRLTEPHKGGSLYSIDMRLKPTGKAGPLIVQESQLLEYLRTTSEPWERQAYLRARGLHWPTDKIRAACYQKILTANDLKELNRIRQQLIKSSDVDLKYSEGGMLDVELFAQTYLLIHNEMDGTSTQEMLAQIPGTELLQKNYRELRLREQLLHLISSEGESDLSRKTSYIHTLAALFRKDEEGLINGIKEMFMQNIQLLNELDPRRRS